MHVAASVAPSVEEYVPAPQSVQASLPLPALKVPAAHETHPPPPSLVNPALQRQSDSASLPTGAFELAVHAEHVVSAVCPTDAEYLPAPQSVQVASPVPALYLPAPHSAHVPPLGPVKPALQMQSEEVLLPAGAFELAGHTEHVLSATAAAAPEYLPAPHSVQAASPVPALYLPATHSAHVPPFGPVKPALQMQSEGELLPAGAFECAGHAKHVLSLLAPSDAEYLPLAHDMQSPSWSLPVVDAYLPAPHA